MGDRSALHNVLEALKEEKRTPRIGLNDTWRQAHRDGVVFDMTPLIGKSKVDVLYATEVQPDFYRVDDTGSMMLSDFLKKRLVRDAIYALRGNDRTPTTLEIEYFTRSSDMPVMTGEYNVGYEDADK